MQRIWIIKFKSNNNIQHRSPLVKIVVLKMIIFVNFGKPLILIFNQFWWKLVEHLHFLCSLKDFLFILLWFYYQVYGSGFICLAYGIQNLEYLNRLHHCIREWRNYWSTIPSYLSIFPGSTLKLVVSRYFPGFPFFRIPFIYFLYLQSQKRI